MSDNTISVPLTVTDYIGTYESLWRAGDADRESHLLEWLEDQLLTVRPRDVGELKAKMDVLLDWINPGICGLSEKGTDLLLMQVNNLRADLLALSDLEM